MPTPSTTDQSQATWHALSSDAVMDRLGVTERGLTDEAAAQLLAQHGPNRLARQKISGAWTRIWRQLSNILILLLLAAAAVAAALGVWLDALVIVAVVVINTVIGYVQEGKAERAIESIRGMLSAQALIVRGGQRRKVDAEGLVPGDMVLLKAGDRVPADLRVIYAKGLQIDEAALTGESVPSDKQVERVDEEASLGDRDCMAYSGTVVTAGQGRGVVVATGMQSEIGRISELLAEVKKLRTPLLRQMDRFSKALSIVILLVSVLTFLVGYLVRGYEIVEMFLAAISLAVAAIPEGLPAIMTITLAIGVQRMARRNAIIRALPAVETLGSVTVICSDKTGTLTRNEMTVRTVALRHARYEVEGVGYEPRGGFLHDGVKVDPAADPTLMKTLRAGLLCSEAILRESDGEWSVDGDPTEGALVVAGGKSGLHHEGEAERHPRHDVIPFDPTHHFMATLHGKPDGACIIYVKGAPEKLLDMCNEQRRGEAVEPLEADWWREAITETASRGQRTLGLAYREASPEHPGLSREDLHGQLIFLGFVGMIDPPREEAIRAVKTCHGAGIRVKMITGDHGTTAGAVAKQMQIGSGQEALSGRDIEAMTEDELYVKAHEVDVFARTSPAHKLRLVQALQRRGEVVAMTGDGVNDAPSLKQADIGISMGQKGTDAAREASDMVLVDDNFASIEHAVEEGRGVYDNLRKALLFLLPTNGGQALTILTAVALGLTLPLRPVHVLWVNMVVAVTLALTLAFEPIEPGVMRRKPRPPGIPLLTGFLLWRLVFVSVLLVAGTFGNFYWELYQVGASPEHARTAAINTLVAGQVFYLFNSRYILQSACTREGLFGSRAVWIGIGVLFVLQGAFNYLPPMQLVFDTTPLGWAPWLRIMIFGLFVFFAVEFEKMLLRRRRQMRLAGA